MRNCNAWNEGSLNNAVLSQGGYRAEPIVSGNCTLRRCNMSIFQDFIDAHVDVVEEAIDTHVELVEETLETLLGGEDEED
jgi:hypothetical protein